MFWKKENNQINDTNVALENSIIQVEALGINVRKQFNFPDGAKVEYINISDKNIYKILDKYENYLRLDTTASNVKMKYNLGRRGVIFKDSEATLIVGKIQTFGMDFPYKMYYKNDNCITATYYYPMRNTEEIIVTEHKMISKSYSAQRKLTKIEESYDNKIHIYEIDSKTNNIACSVVSE